LVKLGGGRGKLRERTRKGEKKGKEKPSLPFVFLSFPSSLNPFLSFPFPRPRDQDEKEEEEEEERIMKRR